MGNEDKKDPHEVTLSPAQGYQAAFQGMGIIHTARKYIEDELYSKFKARLLFDKSQPIDDAALKSCAKREASEMNLNQVCLCFESFEQRDDDWVQICDPIYSKPINNMSEFKFCMQKLNNVVVHIFIFLIYFSESALTGELKITRLSSIVGNPSGGEEIFMFVEKVGKSMFQLVMIGFNHFWLNFGLSIQKISKFVFAKPMNLNTISGRAGANSPKLMSIINTESRWEHRNIKMARWGKR